MPKFLSQFTKLSTADLMYERKCWKYIVFTDYGISMIWSGELKQELSEDRTQLYAAYSLNLNTINYIALKYY